MPVPTDNRSWFCLVPDRGQVRCLVHEQLAGALEQFGHPFDDGCQMKSGASDPVGQGRAFDGNAVAGENLGLAVKR